MYVTIDDWYQQQKELSQRPGPKPKTCSDSELLTLVLVGECAGWREETELLQRWKQHADLFPCLPSLSRFNRRRRQLVGCLQAFHQYLLQHLEWASDRILLLDSVPVAVVSRAHAAHASSDWHVHQAGYGYSHTKRLPFFGYRLHLLVTYGGVILDWVLTSAAVSEVTAGADLLYHTPLPLGDRLVLADKGYTSTPVRMALSCARAVRLLVLPKRDMRSAATFPLALRRRFAQVRQRIETVNSQLAQQFDVEHTSAHSFWGMTTRLSAKLTAHLCCLYAHFATGASLDQALQIKHFAFSP
jgi:hypothetical protein